MESSSTAPFEATILRHEHEVFAHVEGVRAPKNFGDTIADLSIMSVDTNAIKNFTYVEGITVPKDVTDVVVDSSVTSISKGAFYECSSLKSVHMSDSVKSIGKGAFCECTSLKSIHIPASSVTSIGEYAFKNCSSLASINIPYSVKSIGKGAFEGCESIASIHLPDSIKSISNGAFNGCSSLVSIHLPGSVESIGRWSFFGCTSLLSINIPESVKSIGYVAFAKCASLKSIHIPDSVETIGDQAFFACESLVSVHMPVSLKSISNGAFSKCASLALITIPDSVELIVDYAFSKCASLKYIHIPDSVKSIGYRTFAECTSLDSINIPDSMKSIGQHAFCKCSSLVSIQIPKSLQVIGDEAFEGCSALDAAADEGRYVSIEDFLRHRFDSLPIHEICCSGKVSSEDIEKRIHSVESGAALRKDGCGMTALHLLTMNPRITTDALRIVMGHSKGAPLEKDATGMYPLHRLCMNNSAKKAMITELIGLAPKVVHEVAGTDLPFNLALRYNLEPEIQLYLFSCHPIGISGLKKDDDPDNRLRSIVEEYLLDLRTNLPKSDSDLHPEKQHGWVLFISTRGVLNISDNCIQRCIDIIKDDGCERNLIEMLAYAKDLSGRSAIDVAVPDIRAAFRERLLFMGRYDLFTSYPLHSSATCVVVKAKDMRAEDEYKKKFEEHVKGRAGISQFKFRDVLKDMGITMDDTLFREKFTQWDRSKDDIISMEEFIEFCTDELDKGHQREVAIKFMKDEGQFRRELELRKQNKLDPKFVVGVIGSFSSDSKDTEYNKRFESEISSDKTGLGLQDYKYAFVMNCADRNLDTIFRSERLESSKIRSYAEDIAKAIGHLHNRSVIHGDLKLQNVVRMGERLCLIDLDASASSDAASSLSSTPYLGVKYSSGILPPEMISCLSNEKQGSQFYKYFEQERSTDEYLWKTIKPKEFDNNGYIVKTFRTKTVGKKRFDGTEMKRLEPDHRDGLPYDLIKASPAVDLWCFGTILFTLCTGASLFDVDRNDDLKDGAAMKELHDWSDSSKSSKLCRVKDPFARQLLNKLLSRDPDDRYKNIAEVLDDDFFKPPEAQKELRYQLENITRAMDRIEKKTDKIAYLSDSILGKMKNSTSVLCSAIFEATEVQTPCCFVVLPYAIQDETPPKDTLTMARDYMDSVVDLAKQFSEPSKFAKEYLKKFIESKLFQTFYLYLIDEYTGKPVLDPSQSTFPIPIKKQSKLLENILPVMFVALRTTALANKALGLVSMFYPAVCTSFISQQNLDKAEDFLRKGNPDVIQQALHETQPNPKRGGELRELSRFLLEKDPESKFCNLKRVCTSTGKAIWVSEESAQKMKLESSEVSAREEELVAKLEEANKALKLKEAKEAELEGANEALRAGQVELEKAYEALKSKEVEREDATKAMKAKVAQVDRTNKTLAARAAELELTNEALRAKHKLLKRKSRRKMRLRIKNLRHR